MAAINPIRYRGYYYDAEMGMYYLQSRYYDPALKRFINADSYASTGQGFLGFNTYVYCLNNPVNGLDLTGTICGVDDAALMGLGVLVGGCIIVIYYATTPSYQRNIQDAIDEVYDVFSSIIPDLTNQIATETATTTPKVITKACDKTAEKIRREQNRYNYCLW